MAKKAMDITKKERIQEYICILAGTGLMALSANLFYTPSNMVPGGFTGLAILLQEITKGLTEGGIPVWLGNVIFNIPLIILAIAIRGWGFMRRTFAAAVLFTGWLYVIPEVGLVPENLFLTAVIGGSVMGLGLGIVFLGKSTTGGTDTVAALIQHFFPHMKTSSIFPILDGVVIALSAWIFGLESSLYAVVSVVLSSIVADRVIAGFKNSLLAFIISSKYQEIADRVMKELERGVTQIAAKGVYTGKERPVLMCAVSTKEISVIKDIVAETDPSAFFILTDASEIRGEGFLRYSKEEL
jgi:Uncharacterized conserved protein